MQAVQSFLFVFSFACYWTLFLYFVENLQLQLLPVCCSSSFLHVRVNPSILSFSIQNIHFHIYKCVNDGNVRQSHCDALKDNMNPAKRNETIFSDTTCKFSFPPGNFGSEPDYCQLKNEHCNFKLYAWYGMYQHRNMPSKTVSRKNQ